MLRKHFLILICLLSLTSYARCEEQIPLVKDVRGEVLGESAQVIVETNFDIPYLDYVLPDPPRLIIDPIGKAYSDLKDVITFDSGPIKKVEIIKAKTGEGPQGNYYPLDFISIELVSKPEYKVRKETKGELVIDIENFKDMEAESQPARLSPAVEDIAREQAAIEPLPLPSEPLPSIEPLPQPAEALPSVSEEPRPSPEPVPEEVMSLPAIKIEEPKKSPAPKVLPYKAPAQEGKVTPLPLPEEENKEEAVSAPAIEPIKLIYSIGEGDVLDISVWQHFELDKKVVVRPDGFISFPLVGDIKAIGQTPPQLASAIRDNLSRLIKDPQVTVIVSGFGSKNIFVLGEVTKAGSYPYRGGMTVLDAISESGGWKNSAVLNSVMVVRKAFTDAPQAHRLDVYGLVKKGDFSQNMVLEPGDIIYIPKSFIANIGGFIENLKITIGAYLTENTRVFN